MSPPLPGAGNTAATTATGGTRPMVRVVTVNWNGGDLTARCVRSLYDAHWPADRLQVVVVDNGSTDGSLDLVRAQAPTARIVENGANLGFAEGCNRAMRDLAGVDLVALVNNDATVDPGWLPPLVAAIDSHPRVGAACPKILLDSGFVEAGLRAWRPTTLTVSVGGVDVTARCRVLEPDGRSLPVAETTITVYGACVVWVPVAADGSSGRLGLQVQRAGELELEMGGRTTTIGAADRTVEVMTPITTETFRVLNNVGNGITAAGEGFDRGLGERDDGQYDEPCDVPAWCGGGVLLRAEYLRDTGLFDPTFFTYYEDLDLSRRGAARGWTYRTAPTSVLHHVHGATNLIGSDHFVFHNTRNHLMCTARNGSGAEVRAALGLFTREWSHHFRHDVFGRVRRRWGIDARQVRLRTRALAAFVKLSPSVARSRRPTRTTAIGRRPPATDPRPLQART